MRRPPAKTYESNADVLSEIGPKGVKLTIEYCCDVGSLNVEELLDRLREDGAATITAVEPCDWKL